jgi:hypothetical protein
MLDMLRIRPCVLVAAMFAPCLACDADHDPTLDMIEAEREASGWWLRVVEDQFDLVTVDEELKIKLKITVLPAGPPAD